jgi:hypothetical protein
LDLSNYRHMALSSTKGKVYPEKKFTIIEDFYSCYQSLKNPSAV